MNLRRRTIQEWKQSSLVQVVIANLYNYSQYINAMRDLSNEIQRLGLLLEEQLDVRIIKYETANDLHSFDVFLRFQMEDMITENVFYFKINLNIFNINKIYDEVRVYINVKRKLEE